MDTNDREVPNEEEKPSKVDSSWTTGDQTKQGGKDADGSGGVKPRRSRTGWFVLAVFLAVAAGGLAALIHRGNLNKDANSGIRVRTDMRSMATAIEAYRVDYKVFPAWTTEPALKSDWRSDVDMPTFRRAVPDGPGSLTTPVTYMTGLFPDPFTKWRESRTFAYWVPASGDGWILVSPGPDGVFNLDLASLEKVYDPSTPQPSEALLAEGGPRGAYTYDPTNGTDSDGDLWRVHDSSLDSYQSLPSGPSIPPPI